MPDNDEKNCSYNPLDIYLEVLDVKKPFQIDDPKHKQIIVSELPSDPDTINKFKSWATTTAKASQIWPYRDQQKLIDFVVTNIRGFSSYDRTSPGHVFFHTLASQLEFFGKNRILLIWMSPPSTDEEQEAR